MRHQRSIDTKDRLHRQRVAVAQQHQTERAQGHQDGDDAAPGPGPGSGFAFTRHSAPASHSAEYNCASKPEQPQDDQPANTTEDVAQLLSNGACGGSARVPKKLNCRYPLGHEQNCSGAKEAIQDIPARTSETKEARSSDTSSNPATNRDQQRIPHTPAPSQTAPGRNRNVWMTASHRAMASPVVRLGLSRPPLLKLPTCRLMVILGLARSFGLPGISRLN